MPAGAAAGPVEDFHGSQGIPLLAGSKGFLVKLQSSIVKKMHPLAEKGVTAQTRNEHLSLLRRLARAPHHTRNWPLARIALEVLERGRKEHRWCWNTVMNKTGLLAAALSRLDLYTGGSMAPVTLRFEQEWTDAGRHVRRMAHQSATTGLPALSESNLWIAIEKAEDPEVRALLILSWATVGRVGDVAQVKTKNASVGPPVRGAPTSVQVFFDRGKVIGKVDPYNIHTVVPEKWAAWLRTWLAAKTTMFLFEQPSRAQRSRFLAEVRNHLRTIDPMSDLRAVRRGAAQALAEKGVPLAQIMYFTRHVDVSMLRRYLRYGQAKSEEARKGAAAASKLWRKSC